MIPGIWPKAGAAEVRIGQHLNGLSSAPAKVCAIRSMIRPFAPTQSRRVREPAVAGRFYPRDPVELRAQVESFLAAAATSEPSAAPKAIIAPHAGYIYSGPVAASAYAALSPVRDTIKTVVLLGPAHFVPVDGVAVSSASAFVTPLGPVDVDLEALAKVRSLSRLFPFRMMRIAPNIASKCSFLSCRSFWVTFASCRCWWGRRQTSKLLNSSTWSGVGGKR